MKKLYIIFIFFILLLFLYESVGFCAVDSSVMVEFDLTDYYESQLNDFQERFYQLAEIDKVTANDYSFIMNEISVGRTYVFYIAPNIIEFYSPAQFNSAETVNITVQNVYDNVPGKKIYPSTQLKINWSENYQGVVTSVIQEDYARMIPFSINRYHIMSVFGKGLLVYYKRHINNEGTMEDLLQSINNSINNIESSVNSIDNTTKDTQNFLQDETIDDSDISIDVENTTPSNDNYFNTFIDNLRTSFLDTSKVHKTNIRVPFCNKTFQLDDRATLYLLSGGKESVSPNDKGYVIYNLINCFWYFILGRFIILDIQKIIEKFKNGNFGGTDTNIKTDML